MNEYQQSSYDIATISILNKELTVPSITPTYRKELENRLHTLEKISRLPAAAVGDFCNVVVKKGPAELRKQVHGAVIIRQKYAIRRLNGVRVSFEDNAAVIITPEGELKGTDIKGPVSIEASEKWPRIANLASMVV